MSAWQVVSGILLLLAIALAVAAWLSARRLRSQVQKAVQERAVAVASRDAAQHTLDQERAQLDALGQASMDALLLLNVNRQIVWGNPAAWDMFDSGGHAIGQSFIGLVQNFELDQAVLDAATGNRPMVRQTAVGGRTLRIRAIPLEEIGVVSVALEDVTELQRLGRARRDFVANISHELRTPLSNIDLAAQTLRNAPESDLVLKRRMLDHIGTQVQALSQLSDEMMELAQIESGQAILQLVPVSVDLLVRQSLANLLPQAALKNQHVSLVLPPGLNVLADEEQAGRAVANLVHNAVKFTPEGGIISIYAEAVNEDDVRICVSDSGPGIPKEDQQRIFERFFKQDRARSKGGTGLGLAIARHIVEGHGGQLWVESQPGGGATFCFTLPRA